MARSIDKSAAHGSLCYQAVKLGPGKFYLLGDDASLLYATFPDEREERQIILRYKDRASAGIMPALSFLESYLKGRKAAMPDLNLGAYTETEVRIYRELMKVPFGTTITYGRLAELAGVKNGARFAGNTMAKNCFPIFIPCHRVIKSRGDIGNYTGGVRYKEFLLKHEGVLK
jgi:methylated-DNA-[protein]-cysteine S-methyltransferase